MRSKEEWDAIYAKAEEMNRLRSAGTDIGPCPRCGGRARLEDMGYPHHVYCEACNARITGHGYSVDGEQDAIRRWNNGEVDA